MEESYEVNLTLWPATPLPASVVGELHALGVNVSTLTVNVGCLSARTAAETIVLDVSLGDCLYGLTDLRALLATLRLADISYVAWDAQRSRLMSRGI
jgi:hypothetical protein